jgi:protein-disulfide isomerase
MTLAGWRAMIARFVMMNKGMAIVGFILCFLAGMTLMYGIEHSRAGYAVGAESGGGAWSDRESPVPVDSQDPTWGNRTAPVTMVVFSDFECPFCSRAQATGDQLKAFYGKEQLRVVWKNSPLARHARAKPAAEAAQGVYALAGNDAFWKFHDAAFKNQAQLGAESYVRWAKEAGVKDEAKFRHGLESHSWADKVDRDLAEGGRIGVNSTPYFLVNGMGFAGAQPMEKFKEVIDGELAKAKAAILRGTKPDKVYVEMSKQNKAAAPPPPPVEAKKGPAPDEDKTVWKVPLGAAPVQGPETALVTIVEFSDFQCPFSKRAQETLKQIRETYGDKVRFAWKHEPLSFHPRAEPAAELSLFALKEKGAQGFWTMHDKLFALQPKLEDNDLEEAAKDIGLDVGRAKKAIEGRKYKDVIDADVDLADTLEASSTPHFFINGRRLVGAQPFDTFRAVIDEQVKNAETLVAKGIAPQRVYDEIMKSGKDTPLEKKSVAPPTSDNPVRGGVHAKVVIQEFSDFQCPFCSRVEPVVKQMHETYGDKIRFVWRNHPLAMHPDAPLAAEAATEAFKQKGADAFWKFHDVLFQNQATPEGLKRASLEKYADQIGLDGARFRAALDHRVHKAVIEADAKAAEDAGITAAPAFVINGYYITGSQPFAKFKKLIDRALAEAK